MTMMCREYRLSAHFKRGALVNRANRDSAIVSSRVNDLFMLAVWFEV